MTLSGIRRTAAAGLVLCLAAVTSREQLTRPRRPAGALDPLPLIVERYEQLQVDLPSRGVVCYLSDVDPRTEQGSAAYYLAEYSLAPLVLRIGTDYEATVGSFADPGKAPSLLERNGLEATRQYDAGLMLLRRKR